MVTEDEVSERMYSFLLDLPKRVLLDVMFEAVQHMQCANCQTIQRVMHDSMGSERTENGWRFPTKEQVCQNHGYDEQDEVSDSKLPQGEITYESDKYIVIKKPIQTHG
jgi:23S rRNA-/tRNA-specific pseudouridylate synthase